MANPDKLPPEQMASQFGIGKLHRHLLICTGPDCCEPDVGEATWEYVKKRMKGLNIAGPDGPCYRTKCACLRICIDGPIAVVYPEGIWYVRVTPELLERIVVEHLKNGRVVEEAVFHRLEERLDPSR